MRHFCTRIEEDSECTTRANEHVLDSTYQLEWIPWCSRRLRVLMATMNRNIFFRNIFPGFSGAAGDKRSDVSQ